MSRSNTGVYRPIVHMNESRWAGAGKVVPIKGAVGVGVGESFLVLVYLLDPIG